MKNIKLREFKNSDLGSILSVWENASKLAHSFLSEEFFEKERYNIPNIYIPNADTLVAENEGNVIGFISMINNEIGGLFVDPEFHGVGVGTSLVDKVREIHCNLIVEVFEDNTIGRRFYTSYGFKIIDKIFHSGSGKTMIIMKYISKC